MAGLEACKHNLHGRVIWPKGSTPLTTISLKAKLSTLWKDLGPWGVSFIGKGYYEFIFTSLEDVKRVRSVAAWNLSPGNLKLFAWSKDFSPKTQQNSSAQVWVKIYGLSQEYWRRNILFSIAGSIGSPICLDSVTAKPMIERTFAQYARVLVDLDLSQSLAYKLLVERQGFAFFVDLDYENLPNYCSHCNMIGHSIDYCKKVNLGEEVLLQKEKNNRKPNAPKQVYAQTKDGRTEQGTSKAPIRVDDDKITETDKPVEEATEVRDLSKGKEKEISLNLMPVRQNNMFSVLNNQENVGITELQETNDDNDSTQESEFVDATQVNVDGSASDDDGNNTQNSPDQEQINKEFLSQSWANMAADEDAEKRLLEQLETEEDENEKEAQQEQEVPFKLVTNRKKEKTKKLALQKGIHVTRSSTGKLKPFK